jgi:hypothetical protein
MADGERKTGIQINRTSSKGKRGHVAQAKQRK